MLRTVICSGALLLTVPAVASPALFISPDAATAIGVVRAAVFRTPEGVRYSVYQAENVSKGGAWALAVGVSADVRVDYVWDALFPALDEATAPWLEARLCDGSSARRVPTASAVTFPKQDAPTAITLFASPAAAESTLTAWGLSSAYWSGFSAAITSAKLSVLVIRFDASSGPATQTAPLRLFESGATSTLPAVQMFGDIGELQSWSFGEGPVAWDSMIEHRVSDSRIPSAGDPLAKYRSFIGVQSSVHIEARDHFSVGLRSAGWPAEVPALYDAIAKRAGSLSTECASALAKPPCASGELFASSAASCNVPQACAPYREAAWFGDGYVTRAVLHSAAASSTASEYASALDVIPLVPAQDCPATPVTPATPQPPSSREPVDAVVDEAPGGDSVGSAACGACLSIVEAGAADGCGASDPDYEDYEDSEACTGDSSGESNDSSCSKSSANEDCRVSRSKRKHNYLSRFSLVLAAVALVLRRRFRPSRVT